MGNILRNLDWTVLTDIIFSVIPALICITLHELSHGAVAYLLGDRTAKNMGRLTLNPIKHIDITGLITLVVFKFGWAKPVPVNMRNFKNPKAGMAITALAGPVSNFIISIFMLILYGALFIPLGNSQFGIIVLETIYTTAYLSIALGLFNLIPIPPLDGSKVMFSVMSDSAYFKLMRYERYGMIALVVIMVTGIIDGPIYAALNFVFDLLFPIAQGAFELVAKMFY